MPLPIIGSTYRVVLNWTQATISQNAVNVLHVQKTSSTASAIATAFDGAVAAGMWQPSINTASVTSIEVTPLDGVTATFVLATSGAKWAGVQSTGDVLVAPAGIVSLRTTLRGAKNRGRIYLPFIGEAVQSSGQILSGTVTTWQTAWNTFLNTAIPAAGMTLVVASYKYATAAPVASISCEAFLGTQRRRQTRIRPS